MMSQLHRKDMSQELTNVVLKQLAAAGDNRRFESIEVEHLNDPEKGDPLNLKSVLTCTATVAGKKVGWAVSTDRPGKTEEQILDRLTEGLIKDILSYPDQGPDQVKGTRFPSV
jgi:hypothetical protein